MATRSREKARSRRENREKRPHATARYVRISSRKVKIVIDMIRGKKVDEALNILEFTPKAAALPVKKLLQSAIANAENNLDLDPSNLYVAEVYANQGPTLKRYRPRAHGRATPIMKRTSHIGIVLDQINA
ncbi:MAG: 50S ribosomal protein L22 [Clostridiales bacterium]|nr:50S ribosomal protein L22 [Clostridia bacterium]MDI9511541.1 50S ribosomal protein L22 [Bacillota bacterium]NLH58297.1 50S ribosomal protein L22 [Clostridiales bacterium]